MTGPNGNENLGSDTIKISYDHVNETANSIIKGLAHSQTPVGMGILGCGLVILRLTLEDHALEPKDEIKFIQDLTDWVGAYFDGEGQLH